MDPRYSVAGLVVGTLVGLSGVGGSSLLAPILIAGFGVSPTVAVGTDLLYGVPTKLYAFFLHARRGNVDWRVTRALLWGGIPGALAGLAAYYPLRAHVDPKTLQNTVKHAIGASILLGCLGIGAMWLLRDRLNLRAENPGLDGRSRAGVAAGGAVVGFLVALTSIGSGSITLPILTIVLPAFGLQRLIGSEIAFAAFLVPLAALGHFTLGDADRTMALALLIGSLPGVWLGNRLCTLLEERWLKPVVVGVLVLAGSRLL